MISINTKNLENEPSPLYCHFNGQGIAQPAFVCLSKDGLVSANYSLDLNCHLPFDFNQTVYWRFRKSTMPGNSIITLLKSAEVIALLEKVHAEHSVEWDGRNWVGVLGEYAAEASNQLAEIFYPDLC